MAKAKKKSVKKARPASHRGVDDHSFLIILGGGFIVIVLLLVFVWGRVMGHKSTPTMLQTEVTMNQEENTVAITDTVFTPETMTVPVGTTVTWQNNGMGEHSVVSDDGVFDTEVLKPGEMASYTFKTPGTYPYHCGVHPEMTGTIVVE